MQNQPLNFVDHVAKNYEDALGPFIFEPFAVDLAQRIDFTGTQHILELACGSGRLTKHVAESIPASACFYRQ
jgi:ubiquinone/menaquinone biosynthesis C-methylase UbiE